MEKEKTATAEKTEDLNIWVGGKYRMIKKIGEGAFGEIYLGEHVPTTRKVAIKIVKHDIVNSIGKQ